MASRSRKTISSNPLDDIKPQGILKNTPTEDTSSKVIAKSPKKVAVKKSITQSAKTISNVSKKNLSDDVPLKKTVKKTTNTSTDVNKSSSNEESNFDKLAEIVLLDSTNNQNKATKRTKSTNNLSDAIHNQTRAENVFDAELSKDPPLVVTRVRITSDRETRAMRIVKSWSQWSVAAGMVPVPLFDIALVSGIQVKMIYDLCQVYNVPFEKKSALAVVSGLIGGSLSAGVARIAGEMALKTIPYVEQVLQPTLSFATTYSMGYVFVKHFENAGTLLNFDGSKMSGYFQEQFEKSKKLFPKKQAATA
jgi:uncharacterized protein (DUF697 family)